MAYNEDEWLMLSGIQHFRFCRRRWGLIHIEQIWEENLLTTEGKLIHEKVHDPSQNETRGDLRIVRGLNIHSEELGISGQCDVVEFRKDKNGIPLNDRPGLWIPYPVEYKRGTINHTDADQLQLCAQALCLEEMLNCSVVKGYLYYNEIRKREEVSFTAEMRETVISITKEMHSYFQKGMTPKSGKKPPCRSCSLLSKCLPDLEKKNASRYIDRRINEES